MYVILIGYSGHSYVVADILSSQKKNVFAYCDIQEKESNPYDLAYMGNEKEIAALTKISSNDYFVALGRNSIRKSTLEFLEKKLNKKSINAIHSNACISSTTKLAHGIMISNSVQINSMCNIGTGVICNTGSIIEHECQIGSYSHIAPGVILCGNVKIGENTFVGAGAIVKQNVTIGDNVTIGAGTVVLANIPNNSKAVGNPYRII